MCPWRIFVSRAIKSQQISLALYLYKNLDIAHAQNGGGGLSGRGKRWSGIEPKSLTCFFVFVFLFKTIPPQHTLKPQREKVSWTHLHPGRHTKSAWCISISMAGSSLEIRLLLYDGDHILYVMQLKTTWCDICASPCVWRQRQVQRSRRKEVPSSWSRSCTTPASCVLGWFWWAPDTPDPPPRLWS